MNRRIVGIVLAVVLGVVGTIVLVRYVQSARDDAAEPEPTATVLVVSGDVPQGATLDEVADPSRVDRGARASRRRRRPRRPRPGSIRNSWPASSCKPASSSCVPGSSSLTNWSASTCRAGLQELTDRAGPRARESAARSKPAPPSVS